MKNLSKLVSACNSSGIKTSVKRVSKRLDMRAYGRESYVYIHATRNGDIFYVGKGMHIRAFVSHGRSRYWKNKVISGGLVIFILNSWDNEQYAFDSEVKTIRECRRLGFKLVNLSDGGDGSSFIHVSEETRLKQSLAKKGKPLNPKFIKAGKTARLGMKNKPEHTEAMVRDKRKPVINSNGDIYMSASHAARALNGSQGNISTCARNECGIAYGFSWSYDTTKTPKLKEKNNTKMVMRSDGILFNSVGDAVECTSKELNRKCRHQCITESARSNGTRTAYGYKFFYDFNRETDLAKFKRDNLQCD